MKNSAKEKRYQFFINILILILMTLIIVLPFVLVFISSVTDENTRSATVTHFSLKN